MTDQESPKFLSREWFGVTFTKIVHGFVGIIEALNLSGDQTGRLGNFESGERTDIDEK